jgi:hypothetical protein
MTTNNMEIDKNIARLQTSGAIIVRGPYADVAGILNEVENSLPSGCRVAYIHYSPFRLKIVVEGDSR